MTGIEKLRALAYKKNFLEPAEARELDAIADQIEQEARAPFSRVRVLAVISDMESRVSDGGGSFGALVARWARELRGAVCSGERDPAADVSVSAYDLPPQEDREAIAWVRKHGGLDAVERRWECLSYYADPVPRSCMEKRLARLQRQIDECHEALRRRNQRIAVLASEINRAHNENHAEFMRRAGNYTAFADEACKRLAPQLRYVEGCTKDVMDAALDALDRRLMPEGCEWPRYESGELVGFGYDVSRLGKDFEVNVIALYRDGSFSLNFCAYSKGERVKRVKRPAVVAADGEPLEVGKTVYATHYGYVKCTVLAIEWVVDGYLVEVENEGGHKFRQTPDEFIHQRPVLDADGVEIRVGDRVWSTHLNEPHEWIVINPHEDRDDSQTVLVSIGDRTGHARPENLTHERPDSWERIEDDATLGVNSYRERYGIKKHDGMTWPQLVREDLVRRCRALAERERGL